MQLDFPIGKVQLEHAVESFFRFLELSEEVKSHIDLKISPLHRRGDIGFKHRDPGDDIYNDSKDFFHFHPFIFEKYQDFINKNPVVATFLNEAHILWKEVYRVFKEVLGEFDKLSPGAASKIFDNPHPHILLRFLKYSRSVIKVV